MSPLRLLRVLPLVLLSAVSAPASAEAQASNAAKADPGIGPSLDPFDSRYGIGAAAAGADEVEKEPAGDLDADEF